MNLENYAIYEPRPGSPAAKIIDDTLAELNKCETARMDFVKRVGGVGYFGNAGAVHGITFDYAKQKPGAGWKLVREEEGNFIMQPDRRTPEGKAFVDEIKNLPRLPTASTIHNALGFPLLVRERHMLITQLEEVGARRFLCVPLDPDKKNVPVGVPTECDVVLLSAFYAAKEAHEASEKKEEQPT